MSKTAEVRRRKTEGISNIEQGISNIECRSERIKGRGEGVKKKYLDFGDCSKFTGTAVLSFLYYGVRSRFRCGHEHVHLVVCQSQFAGLYDLWFARDVHFLALFEKATCVFARAERACRSSLVTRDP